MEASWHKGHAIVRASNEDAARELAKAHLSIAVPGIRGGDALHGRSPWGRRDAVTCERYGGSDLDGNGEAGVLHPII